MRGRAGGTENHATEEFGCAKHHIPSCGHSFTGEAMADRDLKATDPVAHQPTKADLEEDVSIDATPDALAWAVTRGGSERREPTDRQESS